MEMAFDAQRQIEELYQPPGIKLLEKAKDIVVEGGAKANEILAKNTGIPKYYFSNGPHGIFLMREPENEEYLMIGLDNKRYMLPNFFRNGALGVYLETRNGKKFIGIKPKFLEGPYNKEKLDECDEAIQNAKLLLGYTRIGSEERKFLRDYIKLAKEEKRLMENPYRTAKYILTHESTHRALADIGVAQKLDEETNEAITENVTQHSLGYSILSSEARYTSLRDWALRAYKGLQGIYKKIRDTSNVPQPLMEST